MNKYLEVYNRLTDKKYKYHSVDKVYEDLEVLRPLVEKATPKKPTNGLNYLHCQTCKNHLPNAFVEYCPHCGQKIQWSQEK